MSDLALSHDCFVTLGKVIQKQYKSLVTPFVSLHALMPVKVMRLNVRVLTRWVGWAGEDSSLSYQERVITEPRLGLCESKDL